MISNYCTIRCGFLLLWFCHSCLVYSPRWSDHCNKKSFYITPNEGTWQEYQNIGSMNCNFLVTFIKPLNQSSIKPRLIVHLVPSWTFINLTVLYFDVFFMQNKKSLDKGEHFSNLIRIILTQSIKIKTWILKVYIHFCSGCGLFQKGF